MSAAKMSLSPAMKRLLHAIYGDAPSPMPTQAALEAISLPRDDGYAVIRIAIDEGYIDHCESGYVMMMKGLGAIGVTAPVPVPTAPAKSECVVTASPGRWSYTPTDIASRELDDDLDSVLRRLAAPDIIPAATVRAWRRLLPALPESLQEVLAPLTKIVEQSA